MRDLIVVFLERVTLPQLLARFPDLTTDYDTVVDRRTRPRRRAETSPPGVERRQGDRRVFEITRMLRTAGWAIVPATRRTE